MASKGTCNSLFFTVQENNKKKTTQHLKCLMAEEDVL